MIKRIQLLILLLSLGLGWNLPADSTIDIGRLKPLGFTFPAQPMIPPSLIAYNDNSLVNLLDQKKVTLLYFWSSLTPSSLSDLPLLENLKEDLSDYDVLIAAVNLNEDYPIAREIIEQMNLTLEIYYFPDPQTLAPYILKSVPSAYILNKNGKLVASIQGNAPWDHPDVLRSLKELTAE